MNKKRFAFLMLIGAFVMLVSCNTSKVTENNSPYYPFYDPSVAPAPKDVAGYTEKMGIKRILSEFEYGAETKYNQRDSNSPHYFTPDDNIKATTDKDDNCNFWVDTGEEMLYILHSPGETNYEDLSLYTQLRVVFRILGKKEKAKLSLRIFDEGAKAWITLGSVELPANEKHELIFSLGYVSEEMRKAVSKIGISGEKGMTNEIYYLDVYNPESVKRNVEIKDLTFETEYLGNVISSRLGPYSASGFYDKDDGKWKLWYGCGIPEAICSDNVYYIETTDPKLGWSKPVRIIPDDKSGLLFPYNEAPGYGGDPSVIKVNGTYYMYFSGIVKGTDGKWPHHNDIFVATSKDGINFTVHEKPVVPSSGGGSLGYGTGSPSVVYKDGTFYLYYYTQSESPGGFKLRTSTDGFTYGEDIYCHQQFVGDVKYVDAINKWVGIYYTETGQEGADTIAGIRLMYSDDGIHWVRGSSNSQMPSQDFSAVINHNPGFIGDSLGHGYTTMFYTYGNNDLSLNWPDVYHLTLQYDMRELDWGRLTIINK
jgi:hypothetical protein